MSTVSALENTLTHAWMILVLLFLFVLRSVISAVIGTIVRAHLLPVSIAALYWWVDAYTTLLDEFERDGRRDDFRCFVRSEYRRLRRKGLGGADVAVHLVRLLAPDMVHDAAEAVATCACYWWWQFAPKMRHRVRAGRWTVFARVGEPSHRVMLRRALRRLEREYGYFVNCEPERLACCGSCGSGDVPDAAQGSVFWDIQRDGGAFNGDSGVIEYDYSYWLQDSLFVLWDGDPHLIMSILRSSGLHVHWVGSDDKCIEVLPSLAVECGDQNCRAAAPRRRRWLALHWINESRVVTSGQLADLSAAVMQ